MAIRGGGTQKDFKERHSCRLAKKILMLHRTLSCPFARLTRSVCRQMLRPFCVPTALGVRPKRKGRRKMKIEYKFTKGNPVVIEVSEEWGNIIVDLDREEYNNDHKNTRRHCSLDEYDADHNLLASDEDIPSDFIKKEEYATLRVALESLEPLQKTVIYESFFLGKSNVEIAREHGVGESAIRRVKMRAIKNLQKFFI